MKLIKSILALCLLCLPTMMQADGTDYVSTSPVNHGFVLSADGKSAQICVDANDWKGVTRAANDLATDIQRVTGAKAEVTVGSTVAPKSVVVGTLGKSALIDGLVKTGKIKVDDIRGEWESYVVQSDENHLYVVGSDKRGTIYGIYDISEKIGVSPWYWWADVPVRKSSALYVKSGRYMQPSPKVKYRGIFINNEEPSFCTWARTHFGGNNSKMYTHMFELLLRLKANYLWPAMWSSNFNEDDPMNPYLADEYGIVMGTSHHEPMMRSHSEYRKRRDKVGPWDYVDNRARIDSFFYEGMERNKNYENLVTIGMRGDGDVAMGKGNDAENIQTLREVMAGQRDIIRRVYGKDPSAIPQLWAVYTEVQRYYDAGLTAPDDVTLLFCDNNWGYIRRIGPEKEYNRTGGLGLYYHIDMNGGPWNDRWVNTTTIPKMREQLNLAYQTGLDRIWIINVGDLKPRESAIDFIMHYAWNPDGIKAGQEMDYLKHFTATAFGEDNAAEAADLMAKFTKYNLWRKAEVETTDYFSIVNYHEADRLLELWQNLAARAEALKVKIPAEAQDAYYQLVYYPVVASAGVAQIYIYAGMNRLYAKQGRIIANDYAAKVHQLFEKDKELTDYYNNVMADGKWKGMMLDKHIGYKIWSMPEANVLPPLDSVTLKTGKDLAVALEGNETLMENAGAEASLPAFENMSADGQYIDICNRGEQLAKYKVSASASWITVARSNGKEGKVGKSLSGGTNREERLVVTPDWSKLAFGTHEGTITIKGNKQSFTVKVKAVKHDLASIKASNSNRPTYVSTEGEISIPSRSFSQNEAGQSGPQWTFLPDLGRGEGCMGAATYDGQASAKTGPIAPEGSASDVCSSSCLVYDFYTGDKDEAVVCLGILPTQDIHPEKGLKIGVSVNDGNIIEVDARKGFVDTFAEYTPDNLKRSNVLTALPAQNHALYLNGAGRGMRNEVFDNLRWLDVKLPVSADRVNRLKVWMLSPELVLERVIINPDDNRYCYFGSPDSKPVK
jgi:hypothetical protein